MMRTRDHTAGSCRLSVHNTIEQGSSGVRRRYARSRMAAESAETVKLYPPLSDPIGQKADRLWLIFHENRVPANFCQLQKHNIQLNKPWVGGVIVP